MKFLSQEVALKNAVRAHGRCWIEIVERYFPNRTPIAARNKYVGTLQSDSRIPCYTAVTDVVLLSKDIIRLSGEKQGSRP